MKFCKFIYLFVTIFAGCATSAKDNHNMRYNYPGSLDVIKQAEWGWQPILREFREHEISKITLHHGGEDFPADKDPVKYLRNLQSWSRSEKGWIDIPYHYMIDLQGKIYEARPLHYPGDTNTDYEPTGHALICVMGNYEHQIVSEAQLEAILGLTAFLAQSRHVLIEAIKGHKDYAETLCPGKNLYRYLQDGTIHDFVKTAMKGK